MGDAHKSRARIVPAPPSRRERVNWEQRAIREFLAPGEHLRVVQEGGMEPIRRVPGEQRGFGCRWKSFGAAQRLLPQVGVRVPGPAVLLLQL